MSVEKTLKRLQQIVRTTSSAGNRPGMWFTFPEDLATEEVHGLTLDAEQTTLVKQATIGLEADLRFEYLTDVENVVLRFVATAVIDRRDDHVPAFVQRYGREAQEATCTFAVLHLEVTERLDIGECRVLPADDELVPEVPELRGVPDCTTYIAAPCRGTNYSRMASRARGRALHALALLRSALDIQLLYHRHQFRFRLGEPYAFDTRRAGWIRREDAAYPTPVTADMTQRVQALHLTRLPAAPITDIQRHAVQALTWIDRSLITAERLVAMLYQFFALEAILGDTADARKDKRLAFRRTMLGHVVDGGWPAPERIYYLYGRVRSAAVHGSAVPEISDHHAGLFEHDVIRTLEQYLTFADTHGFTKRSRLLHALSTHEDAPLVLQSLRDRDPAWHGFEPLAGSDPSGS